MQILWLVVFVLVLVWLFTSGILWTPLSALPIAMVALGVHALGGTGQIR